MEVLVGKTWKEITATEEVPAKVTVEMSGGHVGTDIYCVMGLTLADWRYVEQGNLIMGLPIVDHVSNCRHFPWILSLLL